MEAVLIIQGEGVVGLNQCSGQDTGEEKMFGD